MNIARKTGLFVGIVLLVLLFPFLLSLFVSPVSPIEAWRKVLGDPEYTKIDPRKPLRSQTRIVILGDRKFEIPLMYIDGQLDKGEVQNGVNLKYVLPDFTSILEFRTKEEYDLAFKERRTAHMLVMVAEKRPKISESVENLKQLGHMKKYEGLSYGLKKYTSPPLENGYRHNEMYVETEDGVSVSYISCSIDGSVPSPGCSHKFQNNGLLYNIYYNKKNYFHDWEHQRLKAINFINSFEIPVQTQGE